MNMGVAIESKVTVGSEMEMGGGYGKIESDSRFGSRDCGGHGKWSQYGSGNRFKVEGGYKWKYQCSSRCRSGHRKCDGKWRQV